MKRVRYDLYTFEKGNKKHGFHMDNELADALSIIKVLKKSIIQTKYYIFSSLSHSTCLI
jgi:hypothetical protein